MVGRYYACLNQLHFQQSIIFLSPDRRCFSKDTGYTDPIVTTNTKRAPTAEHCQKVCRNDTECTHFTWITNAFNETLIPRAFFDICTFYKREFGDEVKEAPGKISGPENCYLNDEVLSNGMFTNQTTISI